MIKTVKTKAIIDIPAVNGAFVGTTLRPFTRDEFQKLKKILTQKRKRQNKVRITDRDLRLAGLEHLIHEPPNGKLLH